MQGSHDLNKAFKCVDHSLEIYQAIIFFGGAVWFWMIPIINLSGTNAGALHCCICQRFSVGLMCFQGDSMAQRAIQGRDIEPLTHHKDVFLELGGSILCKELTDFR